MSCNEDGPSAISSKSLYQTECFDHSYMQRVYCVEAQPTVDISDSTRKSTDVDPRTAGLRQITRDFALLQSASPSKYNSLILSPLRPLMQQVDELSDDLVSEALHFADADLMPAELEHPHLFLVLDDPKRPNFIKAISYLRTQDTITFGLDRFLEELQPPDREQSSQPVVMNFAEELMKGTGFARLDGLRDEYYEQVKKLRWSKKQQRYSSLPEAKSSNPTESTGACTRKHPACMVLATQHFIFVFDLYTMPLDVGLSLVQPILEDPKVHKIVYDFDFDDNYLQQYFHIRTVNFYDVVTTEQRLERRSNLPSLKTYSMLRFRDRYKYGCFAFRTYPDCDFLPNRFLNPSQARMEGRIRDSPDWMIKGILKQYLYLGLIKRCQLQVFMRNAISVTELKLALLFDSPTDLVPDHLDKEDIDAVIVEDQVDM